MKLRILEEKDAEYMLEWMHDENVYTCLGKNFKDSKIEDCLAFIKASRKNEGNGRNYAIVDDNDEYMGTISLKNIEWDQKRAEYAISCRTKAMGKGYAKFATEELFRISKDKLGLQMLYLYVKKSNVRAQKLYRKTGFVEVEKPAYVEEAEGSDLIWFERKL